MLVAATSLPVNNLEDLIALARAKPGTLNYASSGTGSMPHLAGELLKIAAKIDIIHVPYKGAPPAVNDILGQQVQMAFFDLPILLPMVEAGKLRPSRLGARSGQQACPTSQQPPNSASLRFRPKTGMEWWCPSQRRLRWSRCYIRLLLPRCATPTYTRSCRAKG